MAKIFTVVGQNASVNDTSAWNVASGGVATIQPGTPVKGVDAATASPWLGTVVPMVDGDGTTTQRFIGIAKNASTDTATAAGVVAVINPLPGILYKGFALLASTADTAAEVRALQGKRVLFDLTNGDWTVDAAATDAVANNVVLAGGDFQTQTLYFWYAAKGTWINFCISA